jgi:nucleolin
MARKSAAQIRRLQKRAEGRGEVYEAPPRPPPKEGSQENGSNGKKKNKNEMDQSLHGISMRLEKELKEIDDNPDLSSKARRSAKRKAEAVAAEDAEMSRTDFLEWCEKHPISKQAGTTKEKHNEGVDDPKTSNQLAAAEKLAKELEAIDNNQELKSKDRRSAKRKASAIASEETGMEVEALLELYKNSNRTK